MITVSAPVTSQESVELAPGAMVSGLAVKELMIGPVLGHPAISMPTVAARTSRARFMSVPLSPTQIPREHLAARSPWQPGSSRFGAASHRANHTLVEPGNPVCDGAHSADRWG